MGLKERGENEEWERGRCNGVLRVRVESEEAIVSSSFGEELNRKKERKKEEEEEEEKKKRILAKTRRLR